MSRGLLAARAVAACALALGALSGAQAQGVYKWETLEKRVDSAQTIVALGTEVFGDSVSLQTGTLAFSVTDVDIPGNNALPVRFTRSYQVANSRGSGGQHMLADWTVDVPRLSGRFATDWVAGTSLNRCSSTTLAPAIPAGKESFFQHYDFWQGLRLEIPGVGGGELLQINPSIAKPYDPQTPTLDYRWTTDGQIQLHCLGSLANRVGGGEGFVAVTPDGTRYRFDYLAQRALPTLKEIQTYSVTGTHNDTRELDVRENTLYATQVTDRFGNTVTYTYTNAWDQPGRLTKIASSDGRQIDITYDVAGITGKIASVKAGTTTTPGTRTWTYGYGVDDSPAQKPTLTLVTQPDLKTWSIQFDGLSYSPIRYATRSSDFQEDGAIRGCTYLPSVLNGHPELGVPEPAVISGTVTHPSGASATFQLDIQEHKRSHVTVLCANYTLGPQGQPNDPQDDNPQFVQTWHDWSLKSKQITGPGLPAMSWQYIYETDTPVLFYKGPTTPLGEPIPTCSAGVDCTLPNCTSADCARQARTIVTLPDNTKERYTFGITWQYDEGKLLKVDRGFTPPSSSLESVTHSYDLSRANQVYPAKFGTSLRNATDGFTSEYHRPTTSAVTSRDGATFTWTANSFDALARPIGVTKSSSLGFTKTESYAYATNPVKWVLQQQSTHVNGVETARAVFDPTFATMTQFYAFNQRQQTLVYDTTSPVASGWLGTVSRVTDGNNQTTYLSNWYRGVPQTITYPGGASESAVANENAFGWITSTTDELGYKTCFRPDAMGRTDLITRSSEAQSGVCDGTTWQPTSIVYTKVASPEYGVPANHWLRTETTGSSIKETYFDGLWRPILQRQRTTDSSAGERFVRKIFDHEGRETFSSYPVDSVTTYDAVTTGVDTLYDALGRITGTIVDSELGPRTTSTTYFSPFTTQHTNLRGKVSTTTYQAFDTPSYDAPLQTISSLNPEPGSITSTYVRNAYGNPTTLTREGTWTNPNTGLSETHSPVARTFVYDGVQRLCKTIEPDAGISVFDYDAAGNLAWKATGQNTLTNTSDCERTSVLAASRSVHAYDALNRLLGINHPTGTDDVGYTYVADGAMQAATVGTLSTLVPVAWSTTRNAWTYTYNKRRLLDSESLALDGKTFLLDWSYAPNGAVSSLTYPSTHAVSFNPNAYGEPRQVGTYATGASYHPSGLLTHFNYGNGATRAVTIPALPNTRHLPSRILDSRFGVKLLDHTLTYDGNANLKTLTDGVIDPEGQASESRTLAYDGRDRLFRVTGAPSGNETYTYDPLDRIRGTVINGVDRRFHYHATTQRLSQITTVGSPVVRDYAWNDRGELTSRSVTQPGSVAVVAPTVFRQGFEDNVVTTTEPFSFDQAGRLTAYNFGITYQYDAHGHRVATVIPAWGTRYQVYSRAGELLYIEDLGARQRTEFFHLNGTLVAERSRPTSSETATVSYLHSDHRGTPTVKSATSGSRVYRSRLKPYGDPYDGIWREGPGFTKHAMDEGGNLVYMQQRYYDPTMPGFLSPDSVGATADSFNRYWFANANPYTLVDPDGREPHPAIDRLFPQGDIVRTSGEAWGAIAAFAVGSMTGDSALRDSALAGMSENVSASDGISAATMLIAPRGGKTHTTYTRGKPDGTVYSGRTSGRGTPEQQVQGRTNSPDHQAKTAGGYGPAVVDKNSANPAAIRGREQQLIEQNGGARSQGGTSGNAINGVSPNNRKAGGYQQACKAEFGCD